MIICLERGADLFMAQLMPLPLTVSCFSEIQIGFTFLVPSYLGCLSKRAVKRVCVCVLFYFLCHITWLAPMRPVAAVQLAWSVCRCVGVGYVLVTLTIC